MLAFGLAFSSQKLYSYDYYMYLEGGGSRKASVLLGLVTLALVHDREPCSKEKISLNELLHLKANWHARVALGSHAKRFLPDFSIEKP